MRFLKSALLLIIASFISSAAAVDFTIQQAPIDANALLANTQIGANTPLNQFTLPAGNLQAQTGLNTALLNQLHTQQPLAQQGALTPQQYQLLLQQQAALLNPIAGAQTVMNQLFPQQQAAALQAAALQGGLGGVGGYNPYLAGLNGFGNQFGAYPQLAANNPGIGGLVQQAANQIAQAMNPGIGGGVNPFGPAVGGLGGVGGPAGIGGIGGPLGPRP